MITPLLTEAWINFPLYSNNPTCDTFLDSILKKTRSPATTSFKLIGFEELYKSAEEPEIFLLNILSDIITTKAEQSIHSLSFPPYRYGVPSHSFINFHSGNSFSILFSGTPINKAYLEIIGEVREVEVILLALQDEKKTRKDRWMTKKTTRERKNFNLLNNGNFIFDRKTL